MPGGARHPQPARSETLIESQEQATEHKEEQQVHQGQEKIAFKGVWNPRGIEVFKKYGQIRGVKTVMGKEHGFCFPHDDEQEPAEGQGHMHVAQAAVEPEDPAVKEAFTEDFLHSQEGF